MRPNLRTPILRKQKIPGLKCELWIIIRKLVIVQTHWTSMQKAPITKRPVRIETEDFSTLIQAYDL